MVSVRQALPSDAVAYARLQDEEWDESMSAVVPKLEARIETYPEGVLVAEHDGEVVGAATFIRLAGYDVHDHQSWEDLTDNGWCSTHVPDGPVMFGVDLSVSRRAPRSTSMMMFLAAIELSIESQVEFTVWGGRMPGYHRYADQYSAEEYAFMRNARGRYLDPEVELYSRVPGAELIGVVPEYFKDWESLNYGAMFCGTNPFRRYRFLTPFKRQITALLHRRSLRRRRRATRLAQRRLP